MGILKRLFGSQSIESELVAFYSQAFAAIGFPNHGAKEASRELVDRAIQKYQNDSTRGTVPGQHSGDILLKLETTHDEVSQRFSVRRQDGVTDDDIRFWWDLHPLDRGARIEFDQFCRSSFYISCRKKGMNEDQAGLEVWKAFPMYRYVDDTQEARAHMGLSDEDRPLPFELKDRVNRYLERAGLRSPEAFKRKANQYTSFNALVRAEIRANRL